LPSSRGTPNTAGKPNGKKVNNHTKNNAQQHVSDKFHYDIKREIGTVCKGRKAAMVSCVSGRLVFAYDRVLTISFFL
jgi:hypothetical protein